jgi:hypothetical protein
MTTTMSSAARLRGVSARTILLAVPLLVLALTPHPSRADAIYTWHSTGPDFVTGSVDVSQQALIDGFISFADMKSFDFSVPNIDFTSIYPFPDIPIDSGGIPTTTGVVFSNAFTIRIFDLQVPFGDYTFDESRPVYWQVAGSTFGGPGYWTVSIAAVPEPSSAVLMVFGAVTGLAYGLVRKRQAQRQQGVGGQPQPVE